MPDGLESEQESKKLQMIIWGSIALVSVILIAGLIYFKTRPETVSNTPVADQKLEGAIRSGSPEFAKLMENIRMDTPEATQDHTALGGLSMNLYTTVRNFTGKNIVGLEMKGTVVDQQKKPIKERTIIVVPKAQAVLENTRALPVRIRIEGFKEEDDRANFTMEITGVIVN